MPQHKFYYSFQTTEQSYQKMSKNFKVLIISIFTLNTDIQSGILWNIWRRGGNFLFFNNSLISESILEKSKKICKSVHLETFSLHQFVLSDFIFWGIWKVLDYKETVWSAKTKL